MSELTQISDNVNEGYIAGRDLYLGDQYVVQETLFFEPDLEDVEPPVWTTTPKAQELARALEKDRLIVLAGQDFDDKTMVARHLAWLLGQKLSGEVRVREWYRSSDPQKIETAFHETATTILLLPQVLPHHIGHRLTELSRLLNARRNYTVITTDGTKADWGIRSESPEESLWHEISWETYYGRAFLAETLLTALRGRNGRLPDWLPRDLQPGSLLAQGLTLEDVSARLKQPDRIRRFAEWLQTEEASPGALLTQLDQLGGDRLAIFRWYQHLERADQLLALGLVLFDGLPDDQIFAAVEYLVDEAWRRTDPNLPTFDYRDLTRLSAYFHLAEAGEDGARIETTSRQNRNAILQAAWELQRRRLLAVVPAMTRLIQQFSPGETAPEEKSETKDENAPPWTAQLAQVVPSIDKHPLWKRVRRRLKKFKKKPSEDADGRRFTQGSKRELCSSPRRVAQLQRSVVESLSQVGLLSFEAVEASFLELAVDGSVGVQTVVAKALAAWRGQGHHARLFQVLQDWWVAGSRTTPPKALEQRKEKGGDPLAAIRATVVLSIGYALQYDPPNELAPELCSLLEKTIVDTHPTVRQRVLELALPLAAASHPKQLEPLLRERLSQDQEQMSAIAFGIAMAYSIRPVDALRVLDGWRILVRAQDPRPPEDLTITFRELLLSAVALAYGYLRCDPGLPLLTPEQILSELRSLLTAESHPFVRTNVLMATGLLGLHDFELVAPLLMDVISQVALSERGNVVSVFVRAYLKQREHLTGGDGEVESGGRTYQIWTRTSRPLTLIETSLYSWLRDGNHRVARQIAAQTFAAFAATDLERRESTIGGGRERNRLPAPRAAALRVAEHPRRLRRLHPVGYLAVFLVAPLRRRVRSLLLAVMAEVIEIDRSKPSPEALQAPGVQPRVDALLDRWRTGDDQEMRRLAGSVRIALGLFRLRRAALVTIIVLSLLWTARQWWISIDREPLPVEDVVALQQRRTAPFRLANHRWDDLLRKVWEQLEKDRLEKIRRQKEALAKVERASSGPFVRLRQRAIGGLPKVADAKDLFAMSAGAKATVTARKAAEDAGTAARRMRWLKRYLDFLKKESEAGKEGVRARSRPVFIPPDILTPSLAKAMQRQRAMSPPAEEPEVVIPEETPAEETDLDLAEPLNQLREKIDSISKQIRQIPVPQNPLQKILGPHLKKPPKEGTHGNG